MVAYYVPAPWRRGIISYHRVGALSDDARLTSDVCLSVCLSVAYIGPKSRTERPRKTKIGTEVGHVRHESDTTFKVKSAVFLSVFVCQRSTCRRRGHIVAASTQLVVDDLLAQ